LYGSFFHFFFLPSHTFEVSEEEEEEEEEEDLLV
jgi:hypothetical protein